MKTYLPYSLILAAAASGMAFGAETAYTTPVGYETFANNPGFNFVGVRLHQEVLAAGTLESFATGPNRVTDNQVDLSALITGGKTFLLEIQDGSGIIQEVTTASGAGLNIAANLSSLTFPCSYSLRAASTLNSVFGSTAATCKLSIGGGSVVGADQLWFFNGVGYTKVYFDQFGGPSEAEGWYNVVTGAAVNGNTFNLVYADGFIINSASGKDVVVAGVVKKGATELNLNSGFNFASSVAPTGMTLQTAFGNTKAQVVASGLTIGGGSIVGADQLWFFNGSGYTKVYFDEFGGVGEVSGWYNVDTGAAVLPTTIIPSGYIINAPSAGNVKSGVPVEYSNF